MNILRSFIVLIMLVCIMGMGIFHNFAKMTVKVVDEKGKPIKDADITIAFTIPKAKSWGTVSKQKKGKSDKNGLFSASGKHHEPRVFGSAKKEGYYPSTDGFDVKKLIGNKWHPWNPTITIILKKKRNPVSMYAKGTGWIKVPAFDKSIGYDLEVGDWVTPYGKGKIDDFILVFKRIYRDRLTFQMSYVLSFSNPKDGIQEYKYPKKDCSSYRWPFEAPETGYMSKLSKYRNMTKGKLDTDIDKEAKYIFRVRTETDEEGNIVGARYGKCHAGLSLSRDGSIIFGYYFNPHGNRSLEFDTDKNLFIPEGARKYQSKYNKFTGFGP